MTTTPSDTAELMTREEINELRVRAARDPVRKHYSLNATDGAKVFNTALAAHDIRDQALEEAAQKARRTVMVYEREREWVADQVLSAILSLRGTSND